MVLAICLAVAMMPIIPTTVSAEETTEPSVSAYATKAQLTDDTFSPNEKGIPTNLGKLTFGKKSGTHLNGTFWEKAAVLIIPSFLPQPR